MRISAQLYSRSCKRDILHIKKVEFLALCLLLLPYEFILNTLKGSFKLKLLTYVSCYVVRIFGTTIVKYFDNYGTKQERVNTPYIITSFHILNINSAGIEYVLSLIHI